MRFRVICFMAVALGFVPPAAHGQQMTADQFRSDLVGFPLCGTPSTGPLAGKPVCTVHQPDGTALVAGPGLHMRGVWDVDGNRICRRSANDPLERRRCVEYEKVGEARYRNSDGVEFCIGPCP
jgi:hypothetical protein